MNEFQHEVNNELKKEDVQANSLEKDSAEEDSQQPVTTSLLFNRYSIWAAVGLLFVFIWFNLVPLIILSSFFLFIFLLVTFWKKKSLQNLTLSSELKETRVFAGEELSLTLAVHNNKWLPLVWLDVEEIKQIGLSWGNQEKEIYRLRLLWLLWYQQAEWLIQGRGELRGVYFIGKFLLRSGDGFHFTEKELETQASGLLYVYPKLVPVHVPALPAFVNWGQQGQEGGFLKDPQLIQSIREYQAGDELRNIHWQASAKTGTLQSKVFQPVVIKQVLFYVDIQGFQVAQRRENFEHFLSVIASLAVAYQRQGISVGLASNALDYLGEPQTAVFAHSTITPVLDQLAKMTNKKMPAAKTKWQQQVKLNAPVYYFCDSINEEQLKWWKTAKDKIPLATFYFLQESPLTSKLGAPSQHIDSLVKGTCS